MLLLGDAVVRGSVGAAALLAPWPLLVLWAVYVTLFVSVVTTDAGGIRIQNLLRWTRVPWGAVADIGLRFQLVVTTTGGDRVSAFGGPVAGRPTRPGRSDDPGPRVPQAVRDVGRITDDWERAVAEGAAPGAVRRGWDLWATGALAVLVCWAVVAVVVAYAR